MTEKLKKVAGLALTMLALSAVVALPAHAGEWTTQGKNYPATVSGGQTAQFEFKIGSYTATCTTVAFAGELKGIEFAFTADPSFQKCKATGLFGTSAVLFTVNACDFNLTGGALAFGELRLLCPVNTLFELDVWSGSTIEGAPICVYKFFPQGPTGGITWTNETVGGVNRVKGVFTGVKLKYQVSGAEFVCGKEATAEIKGTTTFTAEFKGKPEGVDIG